jgi:hypothetical protein
MVTKFTDWMHHMQLQTIKNFALQNKEEFILVWQHLHEDLENCAFDLTFITWLIWRKDIDLGWVITRTWKYALFPTYNCN